MPAGHGVCQSRWRKRCAKHKQMNRPTPERQHEDSSEAACCNPAARHCSMGECLTACLEEMGAAAAARRVKHWENILEHKKHARSGRLPTCASVAPSLSHAPGTWRAHGSTLAMCGAPPRRRPVHNAGRLVQRRIQWQHLHCPLLSALAGRHRSRPSCRRGRSRRAGPCPAAPGNGGCTPGTGWLAEPSAP